MTVVIFVSIGGQTPGPPIAGLTLDYNSDSIICHLSPRIPYRSRAELAAWDRAPDCRPSSFVSCRRATRSPESRHEGGGASSSSLCVSMVRPLQAMRLSDQAVSPVPHPRSWRRLLGLPFPLRWPPLFVNVMGGRRMRPGEPCVVRQLEKTNAEMCHASSGNRCCRTNRRNCLAACLAQERADRWRQSFSNESSSSWGSQTDVLDATFGKTSPHASGPRTAQIVDGKVRWGLPMTIRRHSDFEDRQLVLFGTATIVLLVIAWTFAYLASRAV